jgi:DNA mismatch endonuclease (patch repair protein)
MKANRSRDTHPELAVRRLLHREGHRYRVSHPVIAAGRRIRPDITFSAMRIAVFIDGCYWHGCPVHGTLPRSNAAYWSEKFARNRSRDERDSSALEAEGWTVLRYWEHEPPGAAAAAICARIEAVRAQNG